MFKLEFIKLNYDNTSVEPTTYSFGQVNYIYGNNNTGKTIMVKTIDYVLGKADFPFKSTEGLDNIADVDALVTNDNDKLFLKRTSEGVCSYKTTEDSQYLDVSEDIYKDKISEFINRGFNNYLEDFFAYAEENLTCRAFSFLNFINESDLGNISNIFMSTDTYYNQNRIRKIMLFLFNYSNVKKIVNLKKNIADLEKSIKQKSDIISRYNYFLGQIKIGMSNLQLEISDDIDSMKEAFFKFKDNFLRDKGDLKVANGDLTILRRISCSLSEELKYQKNLEKQTNNLKSRNERSRKLLLAFKEILQYDSSYAIYIDEIEKLISKQITENDVLSCKDFSKTIETIEKKKAKIDSQIKACSIGLSKFKYEEILGTIGKTEQCFLEIKGIPDLNEVQILQKNLDNCKKELSKIQKEFAKNISIEVDRLINSYYERLKPTTIKFVTEDYSKTGFEISFNPISVSLSGKKQVIDENKIQDLVYSPGSNARMTTWQILTYLSFFKMLDNHFPTLPIMRLLVIDGLNQPFDEEPENYPGVYRLIKEIATELNVQLFVVSTKKIDESKEETIDISLGFNRMHNVS